MITISINPEFEQFIQPELLERAANTVLDLEEIDPTVEFTIVVDNDQEIRNLNFQFLGIDAPTDVLSFPAEEIDPETQNPYLGDIMISYPRALYQAEQVGELVGEEIQLLVIHGVLHLLGYDHVEPDEKSAMWKVQQEALIQLGCNITHLPE